MTAVDQRVSQQKELVGALEANTAVRLSKLGAAQIARALDNVPTLESVWLTLSVLGRGFPNETEVRSWHRKLVRNGSASFVNAAIAWGWRGGRRRRSVEILHNPVIVDVRHTAETDLATGIQRVARETVKRWNDSHAVTLVTWTDDGKAMRRLMPSERETALYGAFPLHGSTRLADQSVIVPIGGTYLLPELAAEVWRTERVASLAQFGRITTAVIGFDCVPLTTAETVGAGMPRAFARNLTAVAHMSKIGTISEAAASEYRGWRSMLASTGITGPDIQSILLAAEPSEVTTGDYGEFARLADLDDLPLVLVVGSHEPRKNHMAILHAAELLWNEGLRFRLVFIGGNSWNSLDFSDRIEVLHEQGRPVVALTSLPDRMLWAAYHLARFTVFPSLNEGFGLPIVESVSCGTPVVTSDYGSMREVGEGNGALFVDPRDDHSIAAGMRVLLVDEDHYQRLVADAGAYRPRTWDDYAAELWSYFVDDPAAG